MMETEPLRFGTLGPAGTNHELATRNYMQAHGLSQATLEIFPAFEACMDLLGAGQLEFVVQNAAHPDYVKTLVGRLKKGISLVDTFIAKTKPMGIVTRVDVPEPVSIGYIVATQDYFDTSAWRHRVLTSSNADTANRLIDGEFDSGFTSIEMAEKNPGRFRVHTYVGAVDSVWVVYARQHLDFGPIVLCRNAPVRSLFNPADRYSEDTKAYTGSSHE